ncbi:hypothetical protein K1T35_08730 [Pseudonocardia sp. DSM 110487]|uniref:hypothetical protein n=1 Tax=Pseudonocardia sp. DSM 110487 TaxID=2865833 RepID=UPI001C696827|nr:hypothetical protein [Pseudonocardia sp. DSM 110487]QYN37309.1 hypothetical protein K1T35_08730 [Pseudonocardia sp. DSM 110487]
MIVTVPIGGVGSKSRKEAVRKYFKKTPDSSEERNAIRIMILAGVAAVAAVVVLMNGPWFVGVAVGLLALVALSQGLMQRATIDAGTRRPSRSRRTRRWTNSSVTTSAVPRVEPFSDSG